jgi:hypothetical protein
VKAGYIHILFSLLLPLIPVWSQQRKTVLDPAVYSVEYRTTGQDSIFILPHRFIIRGTVHVSMDSITLKEGIGYFVNDRKGEVRFMFVPDSGSTLNIAYKHLPILLPLEYYHWKVTDSLDIPHIQQRTVFESKQERILKNEFDSDDLTKSGSIFRGISIGTDQGMQLQSGLRLQVSGKITPKVDIIASLTDQSTPIQPEGNTQSLQEIDKVFVNIKAPGLQVTMGDFNYDVKGSEFGTYSRKLQGATGTAESSSGSLRLIAAASKGNFTSNHFQG